MSVVQSDLLRGLEQRRFTVLHVTAPARVGGLERVVEALAAGHAQLGHTVHVAAVLGQGDEPPEFLGVLEQCGVSVHELRTGARGYRAERAFIGRLIRDIQPDVVHTHGFRSDVIGGGVARALGVATVSTVHGFTRHGVRGRLYEWLQRRSYRRFDGVVAVSRAQTGELEAAGVKGTRLFNLQNAWSDPGERMPAALARVALGVAAGRFHIGWVGRLSEEKGPDVFIRALRQLTHKAIGPFQVSIIGDGPAQARLMKLSEKLGVAQHIHWRGALKDAARYFKAFDVFVLSSRTEGTPIVLFEAMAAGTPIVSTAVGGIPDVLSDGEAVLVASENPEALAQGIYHVRQDPEHAHRRARAAASRLKEQFELRQWLIAYEAIYTQVAANRMRKS